MANRTPDDYIIGSFNPLTREGHLDLVALTGLIDWVRAVSGRTAIPIQLRVPPMGQPNTGRWLVVVPRSVLSQAAPSDSGRARSARIWRPGPADQPQMIHQWPAIPDVPAELDRPSAVQSSVEPNPELADVPSDTDTELDQALDWIPDELFLGTSSAAVTLSDSDPDHDAS